MIKRCLNIFFVVTFMAFAFGGFIYCSEEGPVRIYGLDLARVRDSFIIGGVARRCLYHSIYEGNLEQVKEVMTHLPEWIHKTFSFKPMDCGEPFSLYLEGTPLSIASASPKASEVANYLLSEGARPDQRQGGILHQVLRHLADQKKQGFVDQPCIELTQFLLSQSWIDVNALSKRYERTYPLHLAVRADVIDVVQTMLAAGAKVDNQDHLCRTPLHHACSAEVAKLLLDHGADLEALDAERKTPLHWVAQAGHIDTIQCLLGHHADLDAKDLQQNKPLDLVLQKLADAIRYCNKDRKLLFLEISKLLVQSGTRLDQKTENELEKQHLPYQEWLQEKIHHLLSEVFKGTYINSLPVDLQRLLCAFLVTQTSLKRRRELETFEMHIGKRARKA